MKSAWLAAVLLIGCGSAVEAPAEVRDTGTAETAIACSSPTGRYAWTWTKKSGTCVTVDKTTEAPGFDCGAEPMRTTTEAGKCEMAGDIMCGDDVTTLACETQNGETITCFATVSRRDCSGEYTLTMTRSD